MDGGGGWIVKGSLFQSILLSFLTKVVAFVDLENDDLPPIEMAQRANPFILPGLI